MCYKFITGSRKKIYSIDFRSVYLQQAIGWRSLQASVAGLIALSLSYVFFVLKTLRYLNFESLLDVGCGDGRFLFEARKTFPQSELVGIYTSERAC